MPEAPAPTQKPALRRMVLYRAHGSPNGQHKAADRVAVIVGVREEAGVTSTTVDLCVLNPTGIYFNTGTPYDEGGAPGTWHW